MKSVIKSLTAIIIIFSAFSCEEAKLPEQLAQGSDSTQAGDSATTMLIASENDKEHLIASFQKLINYIKTRQFRNIIADELASGNISEPFFDKINEEAYVKCGFASYDEAVDLLKKYKNDSLVKVLMDEYNIVAKELGDFYSLEKEKNKKVK
eukprot:Anaeramoba_ignava/a348173_15.p3 GENE.a348173_15~~a348173_15.p3  ORF type:complete len:152 (-),score=10.21 a348173_15:1115-1570(-)